MGLRVGKIYQSAGSFLAALAIVVSGTSVAWPVFFSEKVGAWNNEAEQNLFVDELFIDETGKANLDVELDSEKLGVGFKSFTIKAVDSSGSAIHTGYQASFIKATVGDGGLVRVNGNDGWLDSAIVNFPVKSIDADDWYVNNGREAIAKFDYKGTKLGHMDIAVESSFPYYYRIEHTKSFFWHMFNTWAPAGRPVLDILGDLKPTLLNGLSYSVVDTIPPVVALISPTNSVPVKGTVDIKGKITDQNLSHYYISIKNSEGVVKYTNLKYTTEFEDSLLYTWDTTKYADGDYTICLEARDKAGNKDGTCDEPSDSVAKVVVTIKNTIEPVGDPIEEDPIVEPVVDPIEKDPIVDPIDKPTEEEPAVVAPIAPAVAKTNETALVSILTKPSTFVTSFVAAQDNFASSVSDEVIGDINGSEGSTDVKSDKTDVMSATDVKDRHLHILGLAWYWWLIIVALAASAWWFVAAKRYKENDEKSNKAKKAKK